MGAWETTISKCVIVLAVALIGCWGIARVLSQYPQVGEDPGFIVIDEWAGMLTALFLIVAPSLISVLLAFALFRLFDILKPGPVRWAESLPGAWGIMADDLVAGVLAALVYYFVRGLLPS